MCQEKGPSTNLTSQFTSHHRNSLSPQHHALAKNTDAHNSSTCRGLVTNHLVFPKPLLPVWSQATVSRTSHGIFIYPDTRAKETRHKIIVRRGRTARHNHTSRFNVC